MGMNLKQQNNNEEEIVAEINVVPLIDVMLVLLIVFMVTSSMSLESGIDVELPEAASSMEGQSDDLKAVIVSLGKDGRLAVQGQVIDSSSLREEIAQALKEEGTELVVFEGDRESNYGLAVEVMDEAKAAGARRFAILAQEK